MESYDVIGVPDNFFGDMPQDLKPPGKCYNNKWKHIFNKKVDSIFISADFNREINYDNR